MQIALAVVLLGTILSTVGCKEKTPELDPNSQGGPIAGARPADGPQTTDTTSGLAGKLSQPITNPIGRVTYVCPSTPTALEPLPLPAGLSVTVRLGEGIDSQPNDKGHRFSANVTAPVVWKGTTVVPAGAAALGTVTSAAPETLHDKQALGLHLNMVCFGGRAYALQADELVSASTDASGRSISGTFTGALPVGPASEDVIALPVESVLTFSTGATSVVKSQGVSRRENPQ